MLSEKELLEIAALTQFSIAFKKELGIGRFVFNELRKPPEPESQCFLDGELLHVEVKHVFGTNDDAKKLLGRDEFKGLLDTSTMPLKNRIIGSLNRQLAEKATKNYDTSRVWLLIRSALPLWDFDDFQKYKNLILVPETHPFEQSWLLCGRQASAGIMLIA